MLKPEYRAWDEHLKILGKVYFMHDTGADTWEVDYDGNPGEPKTGLVVDRLADFKDRNGGPIYDNDIVAETSWNDDWSERVITNKRHLVSLDRAHRWLADESFGYEGEDLIDPEDTIVVGNIHQNPELLRSNA